MGSSNVGAEAISSPLKSLFVHGIICGAFLWTLSVCKVESIMLKRTPRRFSSAKTPFLVTDKKAEQTESFTSFMYWACLTWSTRTFDPAFSGPKLQIFNVSFLSQLNWSTKIFVLYLGSILSDKSPLSIISISYSSSFSVVP